MKLVFFLSLSAMLVHLVFCLAERVKWNGYDHLFPAGYRKALDRTDAVVAFFLTTIACLSGIYLLV